MDEVQIDRSGGVCRLTLAAPKRRNALNTQMAGELRDRLAEIAATKACKVLILEGEGPHFCAGMDLKSLSEANGESDRATFPLLWNEIHYTLIGLEIPILVALEGAAVNAGAALALSGDLIVASRSGFIQTGEVQQNMPVPRNAGWLALKHGEATALRFVLLGDRVHADELLARGVVCKIVDDGQANVATIELAERLAGFPGDGLVRAKMAVRRSVARMELADWFGPAETAAPPRAFTPVKVS